MYNKHLKSCSMSLAMKEVQIQIAFKYGLTPVGVAVIEKANDDK